VLGEHRPQGGAHTFRVGRDYQAGADGGEPPSVDVLALGEQGDDDKRGAGGECTEDRAAAPMADDRCGVTEDRGLVDPAFNADVRWRCAEHARVGVASDGDQDVRVQVFDRPHRLERARQAWADDADFYAKWGPMAALLGCGRRPPSSTTSGSVGDVDLVRAVVSRCSRVGVDSGPTHYEADVPEPRALYQHRKHR